MGRKSSHGVRREAGYTPLRAAFAPEKHAPMQGHIWPCAAHSDMPLHGRTPGAPEGGMKAVWGVFGRVKAPAARIKHPESM